ncbi:MAG: hypothetical protein KF824_07205 [Fimbriimonadaceae bacterium]|nr:MAG: hypothetical protein KF824_07205 [Fimbriimonadaceae bacterium]
MSGQISQPTATTKRAGSTLVGLLVFLTGIALIAFAFKLAFDIFTVPPPIRMEAVEGKPIDIGQAADTLSSVVIKVVLLVVMAGFGSMIANRGIKLYSTKTSPKADKPGEAEKSSDS